MGIRAGAVALVLAAACSTSGEPAIEVSGTLLEDGAWRFQLDEASTGQLDTGEADIDVSWRTSVRCADGSRLRQAEARAGWRVEVTASGFRGEHLPTFIADRVRAECSQEPRPPDPARPQREVPAPAATPP